MSNKPKVILKTTAVLTKMESIGPSTFPGLNKVPTLCPKCGVGPITTAVEVTVYNAGRDSPSVEWNDPAPHVEGSNKPEDQPVRCWCGECDTYFPLSEALQEQLIQLATTPR